MSGIAKSLPFCGSGVMFETFTEDEHGVRVLDANGFTIGTITHRDLESLEAWIREARG